MPRDKENPLAWFRNGPFANHTRQPWQDALLAGDVAEALRTQANARQAYQQIDLSQLSQRLSAILGDSEQHLGLLGTRVGDCPRQPARPAGAAEMAQAFARWLGVKCRFVESHWDRCLQLTATGAGRVGDAWCAWCSAGLIGLKLVSVVPA